MRMCEQARKPYRFTGTPQAYLPIILFLHVLCVFICCVLERLLVFVRFNSFHPHDKFFRHCLATLSNLGVSPYYLSIIIPPSSSNAQTVTIL